MRHLAGWKPALACFVLFALFTRTHVASWNDGARMATIESLVHRHTFVIDDSSFIATRDKVFVRGHFYSNKPPVMDVAGAMLLSVLEPALGIQLHPGPSVAYYLLTLVLVGGTSGFAVAVLDRWFRRRGFARVDRLVALAGFAAATLVWPYSTVFNNHTVGGALLLAAVVMLAPGRRWTDRQAIGAGLAAGCSLAIDQPPAGLFIVAFLGYLTVQYGTRAIGAFLLGLLPPLVLQLGLQLLITGDVLPANLHREYFIYPGSEWGHVPITGEFHLASFAEGVTYAVNALVGSRGFLSYSPFLLWGLWGVAAMSRSSSDRAERNHARAVLAAVVATALYLVLFATQYGGVSYGERYFVGLSGVLVLFTPRACWSEAPSWRRWLLVVALTVSVGIGALGVVANPWKAETPVAAMEIVTRVGIRSTVRHLGVLDLWGPYRWTAPPPVPRPKGPGTQ